MEQDRVKIKFFTKTVVLMTRVSVMVGLLQRVKITLCILLSVKVGTDM